MGLKEQILPKKPKNVQNTGMLRKAEGDPQWTSGYFTVPRPGSNEWRLVTDYRYLNSCLEKKHFPFLIIEDYLAN